MHHFDPFQILGIDKTATDHDIRKAYRKLALVFHPDKQAGKSSDEIAKAEQQFKNINKAFEMLTKPINQAAFNQAVYGPMDNNNASIVAYESDQISFNPAPEICFYNDRIDHSDSHPQKSYRITNEKLEHITLCSTQIKNKPAKHYNTAHLSCLDAKQIQERIMAAKQRYRYVTNQVTEKAFLWVAVKKDCGPIYIWSTNHKIKHNLKDRFGDIANNVVDIVDVVFTEIEEIQSVKNSFSEKKVSKKLMKYLERNSNHSVDNFIAKIACKQNKELRPLENELVREIAFDVGQISSLAMDFLSKITMKVSTSNEETLINTQNYLNNISEGESKIWNDQELIDYGKSKFNITLPPSELELVKSIFNAKVNELINRTGFWMKDILWASSEERKKILVADGAAHNFGQFGLPNLLAFEGYQLIPLIKVAPSSKKDIIRDLVFGSRISFFKPIIIKSKKDLDDDNRLFSIKRNKI